MGKPSPPPKKKHGTASRFGDAFHRFEVAKGHFSDSLEKMREKLLGANDGDQKQNSLEWVMFL